jgi:hypothetical protein
MSNLESKVVKLERAHGVPRFPKEPREMSSEEIVDELIRLGVPIRHDMSEDERAAIIKARLAQIHAERAEAESKTATAEGDDHVA